MLVLKRTRAQEELGQGHCVEWFGFGLSKVDNLVFGTETKETIIYELETAAAVLALSFWAPFLANSLVTWFGDNDSVRFALIRASSTGRVAEALIHFHLNAEIEQNTRSWFARVPTEANLSDYPSRLCPHPLLKVEQDKSDGANAKISFEALKAYVAGYGGAHEVNGGGATRDHPRSKKRALVDDTL